MSDPDRRPLPLALFRVGVIIINGFLLGTVILKLF